VKLWFGKRGPLPVQWRYEEGGGGVSPEGLWAMAGNVSEWAEDHGLVKSTDFFGKPYYMWKPGEPSFRAASWGGSFLKGIYDCQAVSREEHWADDREEDVGFRLVERRRR
jgi:formylglycine-generating enzyme required for sulfatase activity